VSIIEKRREEVNMHKYSTTDNSRAYSNQMSVKMPVECHKTYTNLKTQGKKNRVHSKSDYGKRSWEGQLVKR